MTYEVWQGFAASDAGDVLDGATVTVTVAGTGDGVTLFEDKDGAVSLANPFLTDATGLVRFYAAAQFVDIVATKGADTIEFMNVRLGLPDALQTVATLAELQGLGSGLTVGDKRQYNGLEFELKNDIDYSALLAADNVGYFIETTFSATAAWVADSKGELDAEKFGVDFSGVESSDAMRKALATWKLTNDELVLQGGTLLLNKSINLKSSNKAIRVVGDLVIKAQTGGAFQTIYLGDQVATFASTNTAFAAGTLPGDPNFIESMHVSMLPLPETVLVDTTGFRYGRVYGATVYFDGDDVTNLAMLGCGNDPSEGTSANSPIGTIFDSTLIFRNCDYTWFTTPRQTNGSGAAIGFSLGSPVLWQNAKFGQFRLDATAKMGPLVFYNGFDGGEVDHFISIGIPSNDYERFMMGVTDARFKCRRLYLRGRAGEAASTDPDPIENPELDKSKWKLDGIRLDEGAVLVCENFHLEGFFRAPIVQGNRTLVDIASTQAGASELATDQLSKSVILSQGGEASTEIGMMMRSSQGLNYEQAVMRACSTSAVTSGNNVLVKQCYRNFATSAPFEATANYVKKGWARALAIAVSSTATAQDEINLASNTVLATGDSVRFYADTTLFGGIVAETDYYIRINWGNAAPRTRLSLHPTRRDALLDTNRLDLISPQPVDCFMQQSSGTLLGNATVRASDGEFTYSSISKRYGWTSKHDKVTVATITGAYQATYNSGAYLYLNNNAGSTQVVSVDANWLPGEGASLFIKETGALNGLTFTGASGAEQAIAAGAGTRYVFSMSQNRWRKVG